MTKGKYVALIGFFLLVFQGTCSKTVPPPIKGSELSFWTVGGGSKGWIARFGTDPSRFYEDLSKDKAARDAFLLALAENPRKKGQISRISGLPESKVEELISRLQSIKLIKKAKDNWATALPVITDKQAIAIRDNLAPLASLVAEAVKPHVAEMEALYDKEKTSSDPRWDDVAHLVIDKFLVDGTFHSSIVRRAPEKFYLAHCSEDQKALPVFFLERGKNFTCLGCNWYSFQKDDTEREIAVLHGNLMERFDIAMNNYRANSAFSSALFKITPGGGYASLSDQEIEMFRDLDWIGEERLLVPVVNADSIKPILPLLEKLGKEMAEIVFSDYSVFIDSYKSTPYSHFLERAGDYLQVCYHALLSLVVDELVQENIIPPIPKPVPEHFGAYITLGSVFE